jgi:hypothetical protein
MVQAFDLVFAIGHSFGGGAIKWLADRLKERKVFDKTPLWCMLDGVPNTDRFGEFFPSQAGDISESNRWGFPVEVAPKAVQIFQRRDLFPQGTQIRTITPSAPAVVPSHWNKPVKELGVDAGHVSMMGEKQVQGYVCDQIRIRLSELRRAA